MNTTAPAIAQPFLGEASSSLTSMPLPPEAVLKSRDELYSSIQAWASRHLYAFRIERSKKINNRVRTRITYSCHRAGEVPSEKHPKISPQDRKRQTATRKTGCQFSIIAVERSDTQWELRHRPDMEYSVHNHAPSHSISSHPAHRKLSQAPINQARSLHRAGNNSYYIS